MAGEVENDAPALREALLAWYEKHGRSFPWRGRSDPYEILVLEVMSQQTQLGRVADTWEAFLERWPTVEALAASSPSEVIAFWSDHRLGYNRRAKYLQRAATHVLDEWDGTFPEDPDRLQDLPGVGPYTASALSSFAFDAPHAVVDTNVKRVLHRAVEADDDTYEEWAERLLPAERPADWNNAIMDLGATVCLPSPKCDAAPCPWRRWCRAYRSGDFDAPSQRASSAFEGSRRQYRGRIVRSLANDGPMSLPALGERVHEEYGEEVDRAWLEELLADLEADGLVTYDGETAALPARREHT